MALKIHVTLRKTNHSCSVVGSQLRVCRVRCVEVNLAEGGSPVGWQMGREEAVPDRCSWFAAVPAAGRGSAWRGRWGREEGRGHRRWCWAAILPDSEHVPFLLCLCFPGASAAVSLAERESGVLQYRSALWWWVHTCASSCLARASRTYISFPAPFSAWGVFGWAPIRFGAKEATENNVKKN